MTLSAAKELVEARRKRLATACDEYIAALEHYDLQLEQAVYELAMRNILQPGKEKKSDKKTTPPPADT